MFISIIDRIKFDDLINIEKHEKDYQKPSLEKKGFSRGGRIRTADLTDPNRALYPGWATPRRTSIIAIFSISTRQFL